jgi:transcription initiation factor IIF auxiliary subunit
MATSEQEIIVNLWYVIDDGGLIYSLRARCYVHSGTDEEKLRFLQECADTDYLIAQSFPIPERFHTTIQNGDISEKVPMATYTGIRASVPFSSLFEDVIQEMEKQVPKQTKLRIGQQPIVCMTPLLGEEDGNIRPLTANTEWI